MTAELKTISWKNHNVDTYNTDFSVEKIVLMHLRTYVFFVLLRKITYVRINIKIYLSWILFLGKVRYFKCGTLESTLAWILVHFLEECSRVLPSIVTENNKELWQFIDHFSHKKINSKICSIFCHLHKYRNTVVPLE